MLYYEDDFPAEKETAGKGSWLSCENEYSGRKKSVSFQKSKGQSKVIRLMRFGKLRSQEIVAFFYKSGLLGSILKKIVFRKD